mmetsp:Transcript_20280/g.44144  ORF Transcript_20280/g.44144 Transcript_20280/m.44144 type:complete len:83 (-) Transcript_20280:679-927(-)
MITSSLVTSVGRSVGDSLRLLVSLMLGALEGYILGYMLGPSLGRLDGDLVAFACLNGLPTIGCGRCLLTLFTALRRGDSSSS